MMMVVPVTGMLVAAVIVMVVGMGQAQGVTPG